LHKFLAVAEKTWFLCAVPSNSGHATMIDPAKKQIYHSALVSEGEVTALIKSEPLKSKFQKDGRDSYYVLLSINGADHQHTIENDSCRQVLCGLKDQNVILKATGSRDDAQIEVHVVNPGQQQAAPRQQPAPQQSAPQYQAPQQQELAPQQPAPQQRQQATPQSNLNEARASIMQIANLHLLCAKAVSQYVAPAFKKATKEEMSESQRQGAIGSIFIESCRSGLVRQMPSHKIED